MSIRILKGVSAVVGAAALIAACSSAPAGSPSASTTGVGGLDAGGQPSAGGQVVQGGGDVSSISACSLLTPAEIKQALGVAVKAGTAQTGNPDQASCQWDGLDDDTFTVGVVVQPYDDSLWTNMSSASLATPVSGIGEAAYKGIPHAGDLAIKQGGHEIDVAIIDFKDDQQKVDAANLALAKLVLSRV
jgi:hypothetical protein